MLFFMLPRLWQYLHRSNGGDGQVNFCYVYAFVSVLSALSAKNKIFNYKSVKKFFCFIK